MVPSRSPKQERGQSAAEFALVLPVLVLLLFLIIDFGRAVYCYHVVASAAREGARFGQVSTHTAAGAVARARDTAVGLDASALTVNVGYPSADTIQVSVSYAFRPVTPLIGNLLGGGALVLQSASTMYTGN